jgi:hypothetical protein
MSWDALPLELRLLILEFRNKLREKEAIKIQKRYLKFRAPEKAAIDLVLDKLPVDDDAVALCFDDYTRKIVEYCVKVLSGKYYVEFWNIILKCVKDGLVMDKPIVASLRNDFQNNYYSTSKAYNILYERFEAKLCR